MKNEKRRKKNGIYSSHPLVNWSTDSTSQPFGGNSSPTNIAEPVDHFINRSTVWSCFPYFSEIASENSP